VERLDGTVRRLLEHPAQLQRLTDGAATRARPDAADEIARRILALLDAL
jgi:UDP-N-acetylglucosamine:LPS N-acetylglucosamine transferase